MAAVTALHQQDGVPAAEEGRRRGSTRGRTRSAGKDAPLRGGGCPGHRLPALPRLQCAARGRGGAEQGGAALSTAPPNK